ncbi:cytochrome o ubiquinol oxidase subunit IV [Sphingobium vermicomposti]|uniref:Cytochrome bo(3) ubiquinol oxidase subunit 4 n=1 Tax=Sphingobium vermicomposti TaxID=529005 RepID=A0A846M9M5_9SPHN|nr:cytochrome o ubiquinol oxidase subunit IV [Sphingobium vermicomposti]NIJ16824.1 cytochrome o ubiquinol oxidase operon protein cyoD [Sphingobium vermicomposti]
MSAHDQHDAHDHHEAGQSHGTFGSYMIGFALSVILTAIPFWLVMTGYFANPQTTAIVIMAFAVVQIIVHMIYFLHMNTRSESGWTMMALIFTIVLVVITLSGSMWVMYHLNTNMMPQMQGMSPHDMSQMP